MVETKVKKISTLCDVCDKLKRRGKRVALITGCFNVVHLGHIRLFHFAKKYADVLIVGLDTDTSIRKSKGAGRPIFNFAKRAEVLSSISSVDFIFQIPEIFTFGTQRGNKVHERILQKLQPNVLITNPRADKYWRNKKLRALKFGIQFLPIKGNQSASSSSIIGKLES